MNALTIFFKQYLWFLLKEKTIFEGKGVYSKIKVTKRGTRFNLYTGDKYLQTSLDSFASPRGTHWDWYLIAPWLIGNFNGYVGSILILGLGAGAQVKNYNKTYKVESILGIEIDPLIIELGKKHFDMTDQNLTIINDNAYAYLNKSSDLFDLIILDVYKENIFEKDKLTSEQICKKLGRRLNSNGILLINKLINDPDNQYMLEELNKEFKTVVEISIYYNVFFFATNSPTAPSNPNQVVTLLKNASNSSRNLNFFKTVKIGNIKVHSI